jgi:hypothetical protein
MKRKEWLMPERTRKIQSELDPEADGEGLLWVDFLSLPKTFSWRRYRTDLTGLLISGSIVLLLMFALVVISWIL